MEFDPLACSFRVVSSPGAVTPLRNFVFSSNPFRVALTFSTDSTGSLFYYTTPGNTIDGLVMVIPMTRLVLLHVRDYGSLIQQPVYVGGAPGPSLFRCLELFTVP